MKRNSQFFWGKMFPEINKLGYIVGCFIFPSDLYFPGALIVLTSMMCWTPYVLLHSGHVPVPVGHCMVLALHHVVGLLQCISRPTHLFIYEQPCQTGDMAHFQEDLPTLHAIDEIEVK